jgi:seryl-tRNA synthetase
MIRSLLKLLAILVIGILIYNYFLGTPEEKTGAKKIFKEFEDVGIAVKDLLKSEREKFDSGKYDKALDKIGGVIDGLKRNAKDFDEQYLDRIRELDRKRNDLERELAEYQQTEGAKTDEFTPKGGKDSTAIKKEMEELLKETEQLMREMEAN